MPLGTTGDSALSRLGRDLVVTLSANLDGVGSLRAVDAMSVIIRADRLPRPLPLAEARALAGELGARSVLHGSLVREGGSVTATMGLYPVDGGDPLARVSATASGDSVRSLTDSLTNDVLRQIWRRGRAPSPVLADVTTRSNVALRAFLAGEANFQRSAWDSSLADFARAAAADSMFAQAFLRLEYVRSWAVLPPDTAVRRRLLSLVDRLPPRDRELLALRFAGLPTRARIDSGRVLAARYPDYPTAQYEVADLIIHLGPLVGVPIADAIPYLERLDVLAPTHADNAFHRLMVAAAVADTARLVAAAERLAATATGGLALFGRGYSAAVAARRQGGTISDAQSVAYMRSFVGLLRSSPPFAWIPRNFYIPLASPAITDATLATVLAEGGFAGLEPGVVAARGNLAISRGDFPRGVALLASLETSRAPMPVRLGAARVAAIASWMGVLPVVAADSALARARTMTASSTGLELAELAWLDGVIGIAAEDSARVVRAAAAIGDTGAIARRLPRSLPALWRERRTGEADSLIVLEDDAMVQSAIFAPAMPLHRWAIARALVRAGEPARAEHYLQWPDAVTIGVTSASMQAAFGSHNAYQRGIAFEAAGDRARAIWQLEHFLQAVDLPHPAIRPHVEDARARLAKLAGDARR
jgi:hypothetical protein